MFSTVISSNIAIEGLNYPVHSKTLRSWTLKPFEYRTTHGIRNGNPGKKEKEKRSSAPNFIVPRCPLHLLPKNQFTCQL